MSNLESSNNLACLNTIEKTANLTIETPNCNPKAFTTQKKKPRKSIDSISESLLFSIDDLVTKQGLFEGKVTHYSFDCPANLRLAFNCAVKANGSSGCKNLVNYMAAYVSATMIKKTALANTLLESGKQKGTVVNVGIGELSFTQNVQSRPRRFVNRNPEAVVTDDVLDGACEIGKGACLEPAIETMIYEPRGSVPKEYRVCKLHFSSFAGSSCWRVKR